MDINISKQKHLCKSLFAGTLLSLSSVATFADLTDFVGSYETDLIEQAAIANQAVYDALIAGGCDDRQIGPTPDDDISDQDTVIIISDNADDILDSNGPPPRSDAIRDSSLPPFCSGQTYTVFANVRHLVHTANELLGDGPTQFSLGSDFRRLGFALLWTAPEEVAAQGSMSSSFANGQLSGLASRISSLRRGSTGFRIAGFESAGYSRGEIAAHNNASNYGGSAGYDSNWSRWGGFLNGSFLYGDKKATDLEDAFDFEGEDINGGVDYRIDNNWVVGLTAAYQTQEVDFDSSQSIVDGGIEAEGWSLMPFLLYQSNTWYFSGALGYQQMDFESERSIRYTSVNLDLDNVDTVANSSTSADIIATYLTVGHAWDLGRGNSIEPYYSLEYQDINIDGYRERDLNNDGFDFVIAEQNIDSLESVLGLRYQHAFSTGVGILSPYVDYQVRLQHENQARQFSALYASAEGLTDDQSFVLSTDEADDQYNILTLGFSTVLKGAAQKKDGSPAKGGLQAHINWKIIQNLENYSQEIISFGIRYEF